MERPTALRDGPEFGDFIVYVDESGDHSLESIDDKFPVFVLAFCIFRKDEYMSTACPLLQGLKFRYFGHDAVVMHERDITRSMKAFSFLGEGGRKQGFMDDLTQLMANVPFTLVAVAIRKDRHRTQYRDPVHPYHLAMEYGLERVCSFLGQNGQAMKITPVVFECRGKTEDQQLELEFRRVTSKPGSECSAAPLEFHVVPKIANSCGLQLADLVARPVGRYAMAPSQPNRAFSVIRSKFRAGPGGRIDGYGLKIFP